MQTVAYNVTQLRKPMQFSTSRTQRSAHKKSRSPKPRLSSWLCARIKIYSNSALPERRGMPASPVYALRRGRTVKSRTCARMLDICIPFNCDRYGKTSATN